LNFIEVDMTTVNVNESVSAPAAAVWAQLSDFGGITPGGMIERCDVEGEGVGMVRTLTLSGGGKVVERLDEHDAAAMRFRYSILNEDCPLPVTNYSATVIVRPEGDAGCTVDWTGSFEPKGDEATAIRTVEGIYKGGIAAARKATGG